MTAKPIHCADASSERNEPLYGTASVVRRWLLLEQPGAWGSDALSESRLPKRVAAEIRRRAAAAGVRVILIRRGARLSSGRRQCYFLRTEDCDTYAAHMSLDDPAALLDIDLGPLREGGMIEEAEPLHRPVYLVCTHGKHDACCSIKGNRVSRVACAETGVDAWECSHIGGDRFAANLVCFPHGIYYGRVSADEVVGLMSGYGRGVISLEHYRGRCCHPFAIQAAEYFVRRETGILGVEEVSLSRSSIDGSTVMATFVAEGRSIDVELRVSEGGRHHLTCGSASALPIPVYELASCTAY